MKNFIIQEIKKLGQIPDYKFTGYYWMSHADAPVVLLEQTFPKDEILATNNPFCIEALLYSVEKGVSIHVQHTGKYLVTAFNHKALEGQETVIKEYIPHKLDRVNKVLFKQIWEEEPLEVDDTVSFPTLKPSALIFSGFKYH